MASVTRIELRAVRDFGDVLNAAFGFMRQEFRPLTASLVCWVVPFFVVTLTASLVFQIGMLRVTPSPDMDPQAQLVQLLGIFLSPAYGITVVSSFGGFLALIATVYGYLTLYARDDTPGALTPRRVLPEVLRWVAGDLGTLLLLGLAVMLSAVIVVIPCLGFIVWIVGWIYLYPPLSMVFIVRRQEGAGLFPAVRRCFLLARGHWWATFVILIAIGFVQVLVNVPSYIVGMAMGSGLHAGAPGPGFIAALVVSTSVSMVLGLYVMVVNLTAIAMQYFNLVERKEKTALVAVFD